MGIAPLEILDGHPAHAPGVHGGPAGFIQVDCVGARQSPAVVVHLIYLARFLDSENRARRPARPVRGGTADLGVLQGAAQRVAAAVFEMVGLGVGVGGSPHGLKLRAGNGFLELRQGPPGATGDAKGRPDENEFQGKNSHARRVGNHCP